MGLLFPAYSYRVCYREAGGIVAMDVFVAIVLLLGAGFITYLALDAARHVK
jgi:hypothetical protein